MWPATLPITLRLIDASRLSSSELPATTSSAPKKMMPPTMTVLRRLANRLRKAIWATTPKVSIQAVSLRLDDMTLARLGRGAGSGVHSVGRGHAIHELAVGQAHDRARVLHHALV